jgi:hypothetical protein
VFKKVLHLLSSDILYRTSVAMLREVPALLVSADSSRHKLTYSTLPTVYLVTDQVSRTQDTYSRLSLGLLSAVQNNANWEAKQTLYQKAKIPEGSSSSEHTLNHIYIISDAKHPPHELKEAIH